MEIRIHRAWGIVICALGTLNLVLAILGRFTLGLVSAGLITAVGILMLVVAPVAVEETRIRLKNLLGIHPAHLPVPVSRRDPLRGRQGLLYRRAGAAAAGPRTEPHLCRPQGLEPVRGRGAPRPGGDDPQRREPIAPTPLGRAVTVLEETIRNLDRGELREVAELAVRGSPR